MQLIEVNYKWNSMIMHVYAIVWGSYNCIKYPKNTSFNWENNVYYVKIKDRFLSNESLSIFIIFQISIFLDNRIHIVEG